MYASYQLTCTPLFFARTTVCDTTTTTSFPNFSTHPINPNSHPNTFPAPQKPFSYIPTKLCTHPDSHSLHHTQPNSLSPPWFNKLMPANRGVFYCAALHFKIAMAQPFMDTLPPHDSTAHPPCVLLCTSPPTHVTPPTINSNRTHPPCKCIPQPYSPQQRVTHPPPQPHRRWAPIPTTILMLPHIHCPKTAHSRAACETHSQMLKRSSFGSSTKHTMTQ